MPVPWTFGTRTAGHNCTQCVHASPDDALSNDENESRPPDDGRSTFGACPPFGPAKCGVSADHSSGHWCLRVLFLFRRHLHGLQYPPLTFSGRCVRPSHSTTSAAATLTQTMIDESWCLVDGSRGIRESRQIPPRHRRVQHQSSTVGSSVLRRRPPVPVCEFG